ncbi:MAG: DUF6265 family protein [Imperialibacter sp.]|uniref:DUF6265 family protein n=1 Tax=Imperialibacter sp. TaxID=2038411 RepID=UPI0032EF61B2
MKSILSITLILLTASLLNAQSASAVSAKNFKKLSWLEGTWERTNVKQGKSAHERWEKDSKTKWLGFGVSLQGEDTTFLEKLSIVVENGGIYYIADVPENKAPVLFQFTQLSDQGFVCENPTHDFPKKIAYKLEGDRLEVQISGDGQAVDFEFVKRE